MCPDYEQMQGVAALSVTATILVVEDEVMIRLALADQLRECGFEVLEAASANEAKTLLETSANIDLVFSDIHMPSPGDGIGLALWIGENYPAMKVMLTSGVDASLQAASAACKNVLALIPKPYHFEAVPGRIRQVLGA